MDIKIFKKIGLTLIWINAIFETENDFETV